jgi:hypothetical protein
MAVQGCEPGGQAEKTGMVHRGDIFTHVNDTDVRQMSLPDIIKLIKANTSPKFTLQQPEAHPDAKVWEMKNVDLSGGQYSEQKEHEIEGLIHALQSQVSVVETLNLAKNPLGNKIGTVLALSPNEFDISGVLYHKPA